MADELAKKLVEWCLDHLSLPTALLLSALWFSRWIRPHMEDVFKLIKDLIGKHVDLVNSLTLGNSKSAEAIATIAHFVRSINARLRNTSEDVLVVEDTLLDRAIILNAIASVVDSFARKLTIVETLSAATVHVDTSCLVILDLMLKDLQHTETASLFISMLKCDVIVYTNSDDQLYLGRTQNGITPKIIRKREDPVGSRLAEAVQAALEEIRERTLNHEVSA